MFTAILILAGLAELAIAVSLWMWRGHLGACRLMLVKAAKRLDRREAEHESRIRGFVLGVQQAQAKEHRTLARAETN